MSQLSILIMLTLTPAICSAVMWPGEIVGRSLNIIGLGWAGHVGITYSRSPAEASTKVIEVINTGNINNTIQINDITDFKKQSEYWGNRYGITKTWEQAHRVINESFFQATLCTYYTKTVKWHAGKGRWYNPTECGLFRCDTFVNYIFNWSGNRLPTYNSKTLPLWVYNAFPLRREERLKTDITLNKLPTVSYNFLMIRNATIKELNKLSYEHFTNVVQDDRNTSDPNLSKLILNFAKNPSLDIQKRIFLMDLLRFYADPSMISELILLYNQETNRELLNMIITCTEITYQRHDLLIEYPKEKKLLKQFYIKLMDKDLSKGEIMLVIRGINSLCDSNVVINYQKKIDNLLKKLNYDEKFRVLFPLAIKAKALGSIYIPEILEILNNVKDKSLQIYFIKSIGDIDRLRGDNAFSPETKALINKYFQVWAVEHEI